MIALKTSVELRKLNHNVSILCRKNSTLYKEACKAGIPSFDCFNDDKFSVYTIKKIRNVLRSLDYEIVHTHLSHDLWTLVPAMRGSSAKLFLTKHMGSYVSKKDFLHKYLYKRVRKIFAVSHYVKKSLIETCPVSSGNITVIPDFIELAEFDKENAKVRGGKIVIGMAGRFTPGKGHEDFIKAAQIINDKMHGKVKFMIVGSASYKEEEYERKIKTMVKKSGLEESFEFTGFSNPIAEQLKLMDIFVMPSHEESFGIVLLEAMAMKLPVIATNNAGAKDIVIDNESGILIEPEKPGQIAEKIMQLIQNPDKVKELGRKGRKRVEENFTTESVIPKIVHYYQIT